MTDIKNEVHLCSVDEAVKLIKSRVHSNICAHVQCWLQKVDEADKGYNGHHFVRLNRKEAEHLVRGLMSPTLYERGARLKMTLSRSEHRTTLWIG